MAVVKIDGEKSQEAVLQVGDLVKKRGGACGKTLVGIVTGYDGLHDYYTVTWLETGRVCTNFTREELTRLDPSKIIYLNNES